MSDLDLHQIADEALSNLTFEFIGPTKLLYEFYASGYEEKGHHGNRHRISARVKNTTGFLLRNVDFAAEIIPARAEQVKRVPPGETPLIPGYLTKLDIGESQDVDLCEVHVLAPVAFLIVVKVRAQIVLPDDPSAAGMHYGLFTVDAPRPPKL
ncbi:MAG: hypothetical protein OEU32_09435 [Acidimicrobiia bacterium]|nr:hypothetical protein [Acidimicrobiia bacterium]